MFFFNKINKLRMEHQELKERYSKTRYREVELKKELENLAEVENENKFIESLLKKSYIIDGFETNKDDVRYYVCVNVSSDRLDLFLRNRTSGNECPRLYAALYKDTKPPYAITCHIEDIFAREEDVGNGSILLKHLIKWAKKLRVCQLSGGLSNVDKERFNKLEKFYRKNGFTVKINETRTAGTIKLEL